MQFYQMIIGSNNNLMRSSYLFGDINIKEANVNVIAILIY